MPGKLVIAALSLSLACSAAAPAGKPPAAPAPVAPPIAIAEVAAAEPALPKAEPAAPPALSAETKALVRHFPAVCSEARLYVDATQLLDPSTIVAIDGIIAKQTGTKAKKTKKSLSILEEAGFHPLRDLKAVAACAQKNQDDNLFAMTVDLSRAKEPMNAIARALTEANGKPARVENKGDITWVLEKGGEAMALIDATTLLFGKKAAIERALTQSDGEAGFPDAAGYAIWMNWQTVGPAQLRAKLIGDHIAVRALVDVGSQAPDMQRSALQMRDQFIGMPGIPAALRPAIENLTAENDGGVVIITTELSSDALKVMLEDEKTQSQLGALAL